ncbi:hypothetical protein KC19_11G042100 [Ceratodon purpureus]|uniref:Secreted protein n=1 Tax=Ceratodon purpureus TaxID=3225 RepID=A0A8T0GGJ7_CERPU|nr:hypothetical protein KC19_11G042100 [Ceratodon purpureus]
MGRSRALSRVAKIWLWFRSCDCSVAGVNRGLGQWPFGAFCRGSGLVLFAEWNFGRVGASGRVTSGIRKLRWTRAWGATGTRSLLWEFGSWIEGSFTAHWHSMLPVVE